MADRETSDDDVRDDVPDDSQKCLRCCLLRTERQLIDLMAGAEEARQLAAGMDIEVCPRESALFLMNTCLELLSIHTTTLKASLQDVRARRERTSCQRGCDCIGGQAGPS